MFSTGILKTIPAGTIASRWPDCCPASENTAPPRLWNQFDLDRYVRLNGLDYGKSLAGGRLRRRVQRNGVLAIAGSADFGCETRLGQALVISLARR